MSNFGTATLKAAVSQAVGRETVRAGGKITNFGTGSDYLICGGKK
jgi:hypothetical protein